MGEQQEPWRYLFPNAHLDQVMKALWSETVDESGRELRSTARITPPWVLIGLT